MRLFLTFCLVLAALGVSMDAGAGTALASSPLRFSYSDFSSTAGLTLSGTATSTGSALQLTTANVFDAGSAFYSTPVNTQFSFESQFVFSMHDFGETGYGPADGLTFTLQSAGSNALGGAGGYLGYGGITPSAAVAFNMYYDGGKPPISLLAGGDAYTYPDSYLPPFSLYGAPVHVWIDYAGSSHVLGVYVSQTAMKPTSPIMRYVFNIAALVGPTAYAGFTGGTGNGDMDQDILNWQFAQSQPDCSPGNVNAWADTLLDGCNWTHMAVPGAVFTGSSLRGASLRHAVLTGAVFGNADLTDADLSNAVATNANFVGGTLVGTNFTGALLRNANFTSADLTDARLDGARLMGAVLRSANLTGAVLTGARLDGANLTSALGLTAAKLSGVHWYRTTCPDGSNTGVKGTCIGHVGPG